jgi:hypothetical protein
MLHESHAKQPDKLWVTNLWDAETLDAQGKDGRKTYEVPYVIKQVSKSTYIMMMKMNWKGYGSKRLWPNLRYCPGIWLEGHLVKQEWKKERNKEKHERKKNREMEGET